MLSQIRLATKLRNQEVIEKNVRSSEDSIEVSAEMRDRLAIVLRSKDIDGSLSQNLSSSLMQPLDALSVYCPTGAATASQFAAFCPQSERKDLVGHLSFNQCCLESWKDTTFAERGESNSVTNSGAANRATDPTVQLHLMWLKRKANIEAESGLYDTAFNTLEEAIGLHLGTSDYAKADLCGYVDNIQPVELIAQIDANCHLYTAAAHVNASRIQNVFRHFRMKRGLATIVLSKYYRGYVTRKFLWERREVHDQCATTIQRVLRAHKKRREALATKLQRWYILRLQMKLHALMLLNHRAACNIQSFFTGNKGKMGQILFMRLKIVMATIIQKMLRGFFVRNRKIRAEVAMKKQLYASALTAQNTVRQMVARKKRCHLLLLAEECEVKRQCHEDLYVAGEVRESIALARYQLATSAGRLYMSYIRDCIKRNDGYLRKSKIAGTVDREDGIREAATVAFKLLNITGSGSIEREEFIDALRELDIILSAEDACAIYDMIGGHSTASSISQTDPRSTCQIPQRDLSLGTFFAWFRGHTSSQQMVKGYVQNNQPETNVDLEVLEGKSRRFLTILKKKLYDMELRGSLLSARAEREALQRGLDIIISSTVSVFRHHAPPRFQCCQCREAFWRYSLYMAHFNAKKLCMKTGRRGIFFEKCAAVWKKQRQCEEEVVRQNDLNRSITLATCHSWFDGLSIYNSRPMRKILTRDAHSLMLVEERSLRNEGNSNDTPSRDPRYLVLEMLEHFADEPVVLDMVASVVAEQLSCPLPVAVVLNTAAGAVSVSGISDCIPSQGQLSSTSSAGTMLTIGVFRKWLAESIESSSSMRRTLRHRTLSADTDNIQFNHQMHISTHRNIRGNRFDADSCTYDIESVPFSSFGINQVQDPGWIQDDIVMDDGIGRAIIFELKKVKDKICGALSRVKRRVGSSDKRVFTDADGKASAGNSLKVKEIVMRDRIFSKSAMRRICMMNAKLLRVLLHTASSALIFSLQFQHIRPRRLTPNDSELDLSGLDALQSTTLTALSIKLATRFSVLLTLHRTLYPPEKATEINTHVPGHECTAIRNFEVLDLYAVENVRAMQRIKTPLGKEHIKLISAQLYATQKRMLYDDHAGLDQFKPPSDGEIGQEIKELSGFAFVKDFNGRTHGKLKYLLHRFAKPCYVRNPHIQDCHSFYDIYHLGTSTYPPGVISEDHGCDILNLNLLLSHFGLHVDQAHLASLTHEIDPLSTGWVSLTKLKTWVEFKGRKYRSAWLIARNLVREVCGRSVGAYNRDAAEVLLLSGRRRARLERHLLLQYMPPSSTVSPPVCGHPLTGARVADSTSVSVSSGTKDGPGSLTTSQANEIIDELCSLTAASAACESILLYRDVEAAAIARQRGARWCWHKSHKALKGMEAHGDAANECMTVAAEFCSNTCLCPRCSADEKNTSFVQGCEAVTIARPKIHCLTLNTLANNPEIRRGNDRLDVAVNVTANMVGSEVIPVGGLSDTSKSAGELSAELDLRTTSKDVFENSFSVIDAQDSACTKAFMCTALTNRILMACRLADVFNLGDLSWREVSVCLRYLGRVVDNHSEGQVLFLLPAILYRRVRYDEVAHFVTESEISRCPQRTMAGVLESFRKHLRLRSSVSSNLTLDHFLLNFQNRIVYSRKCKTEEFWNVRYQGPLSSQGNVDIKSLIDESREEKLSLFMTHVNAMQSVTLDLQGRKGKKKIAEEMKRIAGIKERYPSVENSNELEHFLRFSFRVFAVHETLLQISEVPYLLHFCVREFFIHWSKFFKSDHLKADEAEWENRIKRIGEEETVHILLPLLSIAHLSLTRENQDRSLNYLRVICSGKTNNTAIATCSLKSAARQAAVLTALSKK